MMQEKKELRQMERTELSQPIELPKKEMQAM
jgi:hypothetical protein